jgi:hypothetical protein
MIMTAMDNQAAMVARMLEWTATTTQAEYILALQKSVII